MGSQRKEPGEARYQGSEVGVGVGNSWWFPELNHLAAEAGEKAYLEVGVSDLTKEVISGLRMDCVPADLNVWLKIALSPLPTSPQL